ncbi:MAG: hypothetical protein COS14_02805 [Bacteroidetes bacterium CG02_land_8_20_14_3_00_31_25]|nr:MAG: hypothetical protein COS14_02805 [Bacteroidetes bacterium CG02_land_8_20_14_3_00_31_25]PIX32336.1 MAG: hypothetical protein COZ59_14570 [Bacteroidetes bacterium CG_4_8_14_3_um_filter_31_14]
MNLIFIFRKIKFDFMNYLSLILIVVPFLMANSCKSAKNVEKTKSSSTSQIPVKKVIVNKNFDYINYKKEFTVKTATIADSILTIVFSYVGCSDDEINIEFNGNYLKSLPPKASLYITKTSGSLECGKQIEKTMLFNLSSIQYPNTKTLVIMFPNYESKLMYNY